ncbi:hypothetical protein [Bacillus sp. T33-2]|nr:hypothetical protein [Bacillus sp. T33-2]
MIGDTIYVNLSSLIVKGKVIEIIGDKLVVELEDQSRCIVVKEQIVK